MKISTGWIVAGLALIALIITIAWNCSGKKNDKIEAEIAAQQARDKAKDDSLQAAMKRLDSIAEIARKNDLDLQETKIKQEIIESELRQKDNRIATLKIQIDRAKGRKDTVEIVKNCDSLYDIAESLSAQVESYIEYTDTLINNYERKLYFKDQEKREWQKLYTDLKPQYDELSGKYTATLKKTKVKRFAVGPTVAAGVGHEFKGTVVVGVGITYSLFKF